MTRWASLHPTCTRSLNPNLGMMNPMVDEKSQGRRYGRFEMQKMLEIFRADERIRNVGISYEPGN
jgi:hypothetical protein